MLRTRVISAGVLLALVAAPAYMGGWLFWALVALIGVLGAWEYVHLLRQGGYQPSQMLAIILTLALIVQARWPEALPLPLLLTLIIWGSFLATLWHRAPQPVSDWALTLAGALYLGWSLRHVVLLRELPTGLAWLLLAALIVWAADVSAYFTGRALGRHPWWPRHSPKKSWEGFAGGALAATVVAALAGPALLGLHWLEAAALGLVIGLVAPLGDLDESMIKRQVGAKDSGRLIPGHGGVLDRIDTLLIAIPLVFYWASLIPRWP